jgi:beta-lactamase class A
MLKRSLGIAAAVAAVIGGAARVATSDPSAGGLRSRVESLIRKSGADVAVAYRTLDGGEAMLIQPDVEFHAASTMKVAVLIELYRQARAGRLALDDEIPVVNEFHSIVDGSVFRLDTGDASDVAVVRHLGGRMSYRALAEAMITVSSNFATNLIIERVGAKNVQATVDAMGASGMRVLRGVEDNKAYDKGLNNVATARALLTLMEGIAKNAAVDKTASEEMAAILRRQTVNDRIPAGLPPGVAVAHKTGEITRIRHDAAIVYAPRPFVLVVLIRGLNEGKKASALAAGITRLIYEASNPTR